MREEWLLSVLITSYCLQDASLCVHLECQSRPCRKTNDGLHPCMPRLSIQGLPERQLAALNPPHKAITGRVEEKGREGGRERVVEPTMSLAA